jgi:hypothetical protein
MISAIVEEMIAALLVLGLIWVFTRFLHWRAIFHFRAFMRGWTDEDKGLGQHANPYSDKARALAWEKGWEISRETKPGK